MTLPSKAQTTARILQQLLNAGIQAIAAFINAVMIFQNHNPEDRQAQGAVQKPL